MKMQITSGNLLLVFIYSLFMLLFGCSIGMYWHGSPTIALCLAILGASLWVFHELITVLLWFGVTAAWTRMAATTTDTGGGARARRERRDSSG
jgi:hypothetical protein